MYTYTQSHTTVVCTIFIKKTHTHNYNNNNNDIKITQNAVRVSHDFVVYPENMLKKINKIFEYYPTHRNAKREELRCIVNFHGDLRRLVTDLHTDTQTHRRVFCCDNIKKNTTTNKQYQKHKIKHNRINSRIHMIIGLNSSKGEVIFSSARRK